MIGVDANVLIALAVGTHPLHLKASELVKHEFADGRRPVLSPSVVAEFLHVVTDPRRITPTPSMAEAIAWFERWSGSVSPEWLIADKQGNDLWLEWMVKFRLGRKRILDTQFAAYLHTRGVKRLATSNQADFAIFGVFEVVPLQ